MGWHHGAIGRLDLAMAQVPLVTLRTPVSWVCPTATSRPLRAPRRRNSLRRLRTDDWPWWPSLVAWEPGFRTFHGSKFIISQPLSKGSGHFHLDLWFHHASFFRCMIWLMAIIQVLSRHGGFVRTFLFSSSQKLAPFRPRHVLPKRPDRRSLGRLVPLHRLAPARLDPGAGVHRRHRRPLPGGFLGSCWHHRQEESLEYMLSCWDANIRGLESEWLCCEQN